MGMIIVYIILGAIVAVLAFCTFAPLFENWKLIRREARDVRVYPHDEAIPESVMAEIRERWDRVADAEHVGDVIRGQA